MCWAYNEEDSIGEFLEKAMRLLDSVVEDYEIVLIDDGSTDNTYSIAKEFQEDHQNLKIIRNERNLNVGISSQRAIQNASKEFLFWQTIDWSYDISNLRIFLEYLRIYDIVLGVRREPVQVKIRLVKPLAAVLRLFGMKHLTRRSDTISRAIISLINYLFLRILFRVPASDFQNITFYPTKWIQSIKKDSNSSLPEHLIKSYWNGKSIKEVPINFIPRKKGKAKGTKLIFLMKVIQDILICWFKWTVLGQRGNVHKGKICRLNPEEWKELV